MPSNYLPNQGLTFRKLSNEKLGRIHAASLEILERTGLRLLEPNAVQLLKLRGRLWKTGTAYISLPNWWNGP